MEQSKSVLRFDTLSHDITPGATRHRPSFSLRPLHSILKKQRQKGSQSQDSSVYAVSANDIDFFIGDEVINCDRLIQPKDKKQTSALSEFTRRLTGKKSKNKYISAIAEYKGSIMFGFSDGALLQIEFGEEKTVRISEPEFSKKEITRLEIAEIDDTAKVHDLLISLDEEGVLRAHKLPELKLKDEVTPMTDKNCQMLAVKKPGKEKGKIKDFQIFQKREALHIAALTSAKSIRIYEIMPYLNVHIEVVIQLMEIPYSFVCRENVILVQYKTKLELITIQEFQTPEYSTLHSKNKGPIEQPLLIDVQEVDLKPSGSQVMRAPPIWSDLIEHFLVTIANKSIYIDMRGNHNDAHFFIEWSKPPFKVIQVRPYIVGFLPSRIEIRSAFKPNTILQIIEHQKRTCLTFALTVADTQTESHRVTQAVQDFYVLMKKDNVDSNYLMVFEQMAMRDQIKAMLYRKHYSTASRMCDYCLKTRTDGVSQEEREQLQLERGLYLFVYRENFDQAASIFKQYNLRVDIILLLFSDFFPKTYVDYMVRLFNIDVKSIPYFNAKARQEIYFNSHGASYGLLKVFSKKRSIKKVLRSIRAFLPIVLTHRKRIIDKIRQKERINFHQFQPYTTRFTEFEETKETSDFASPLTSLRKTVVENKLPSLLEQSAKMTSFRKKRRFNSMSHPLDDSLPPQYQEWIERRFQMWEAERTLQSDPSGKARESRARVRSSGELRSKSIDLSDKTTPEVKKNVWLKIMCEIFILHGLIISIQQKDDDHLQLKNDFSSLLKSNSLPPVLTVDILLAHQQIESAADFLYQKSDAKRLFDLIQQQFKEAPSSEKEQKWLNLFVQYFQKFFNNPFKKEKIRTSVIAEHIRWIFDIDKEQALECFKLKDKKGNPSYDDQMLQIGESSGIDNYLSYLDYLTQDCKFKDPKLYLEQATTSLKGIYSLFPAHPPLPKSEHAFNPETISTDPKFREYSYRFREAVKHVDGAVELRNLIMQIPFEIMPHERALLEALAGNYIQAFQIELGTSTPDLWGLADLIYELKDPNPSIYTECLLFSLSQEPLSEEQIRLISLNLSYRVDRIDLETVFFTLPEKEGLSFKVFEDFILASFSRMEIQELESNYQRTLMETLMKQMKQNKEVISQTSVKMTPHDHCAGCKTSFTEPVFMLTTNGEKYHYHCHQGKQLFS